MTPKFAALCFDTAVNTAMEAIDKVRDRMDNIKGTTYHIDGITYDEGSDVAEAIKTLVRAAKIERRT